MYRTAPWSSRPSTAISGWSGETCSDLHQTPCISALRNLWAMCRRYVLISIPGGELDKHGRRMGRYRHYTKDGLVQTMEQAGFRVVRIFTCGWLVHSLLYCQLVRRLPRNAVE